MSGLARLQASGPSGSTQWPISCIEQPAAQASGEEEAQAPIRALSEDLLRIILTYATQDGQDVKTLSAVRAVDWQWSMIVDTEHLRKKWEKLQQGIQSPPLRGLVDQIGYVDRFVSQVIASVVCPGYASLMPSDQACLFSKIESMGPSWFSRFSLLTQKLREKGVPIPLTHAIIGFEPAPYEEMQQQLDTVLAAIWKGIQKKSYWVGMPTTDNAETIRAWLSDPANAGNIDAIDGLDLWVTNLLTLPLEALPSEIGRFSQVTSIGLAGHRLTTLPLAIGNLSLLTSISLHNNQFRTFPLELNQLSQLTAIYFSKNQLTTLPPEIGDLSQLQTLDLSENRLSTLPSEIGRLSQLLGLDLSKNQLTTLPPEMGKLSQLQGLYLSSNRLTTLPPEMGKLSKLEWLSLHGNPFMFLLGKDFAQLGARETSVSQVLIDNFLACSSYTCRTPFAALCQEIHLGKEESFLRDTFETLSDKMKQRIRTAWAAIPASSSPSLEAGANLFADRANFSAGVIKALQGKWRSFSQEQRNRAYAQVAVLAGKPEEGAPWGEAQADKNIMRLIDAMELTTDSF